MQVTKNGKLENENLASLPGNHANKTLYKFSVADLVDIVNPDWQAIRNSFLYDKTLFEETLFKLHFRRKKTSTDIQQENILRFLATGYLSTNDVRYFNEFLWFYKEGSRHSELKKECEANFTSNLDKNGNHSFTGVTPLQAREYMKQYQLADTPDFDNTQKVGLIGFPPFFPKIIEGLNTGGFKNEQVFIPFHPNKRIKQVLSISLLVKMISLVKGNKFKYDTIKLKNDDPAIKEILSKHSFDVGFHKLNCIIRENIFGSFKKGLINDHWGLLPYLRGKSTIAYTVLFGFPMVATMHLIEKGIDTGKIVGYSEEFNIAEGKDLEGVRNLLREALPARVIKSLKQLSAKGFVPFENEIKKGLTFYEIHPWIYNYINENMKRTASK